MPNVRLRDEPPPEDAFVVIRGGTLEDRTDDDVRERARKAATNIGLLAQSVLVVDRETVVDVCQRDARLTRYPRVNLSTVGRLRRAGFPLEPTGDAPHYSVVFPDVEAETIQRFRGAFDAAQPNPPTTLPG